MRFRFFVLFGLTATLNGFGCELITAPDRSKIDAAGTAGSGFGGNTGGTSTSSQSSTGGDVGGSGGMSTQGGSAGSSTGGVAGSGGVGASAGSGGVAGSGGIGGSGGITQTTGTGGSGACDPGTSKECDGNCVSLNDPATHCADMNVCAPCGDSQYHITLFCNPNGTCGSGGCVQGWAECDGNLVNGCETDLTNSLANCGSCGNTCQPGQTCNQSKCVPLCGSKPVPSTGYAACLVLDNSSLAVGSYATMTVKVGSPALSGPSDAVSPGCISSVPANVDNSNDPSVLCPIPGLAAGQNVYMASKAYGNGDLAVENPPFPFNAFGCDTQNIANGKCLGKIRVYEKGVLKATFVHPAAAPFSYFDQDLSEPLQVEYTAQ